MHRVNDNISVIKLYQTFHFVITVNSKDEIVGYFESDIAIKQSNRNTHKVMADKKRNGCKSDQCNSNINCQ